MNLAGLSLRDLEYVVAVAEQRHFGKAAERCSVSQPSLSAQIRKLEDLLGIPLFERTSRRVLPTPQGEVVIRQARVVLEEARRLLALARGTAGALHGPLAIAAIQTLGPYLFPMCCRRCAGTCPTSSSCCPRAAPTACWRNCARGGSTPSCSPCPSRRRD
nr:LysR family transcriptional regulator [Azospirillum argentinense]